MNNETFKDSDPLIRLYHIGETDWRLTDQAGNTIWSNAAWTLAYDGYGRLLSAAKPQSSYGYNAFHQRTRKTVGGVTTSFLYGPRGELLYETDGTNSKIYVYLDDMPLARIDNNSQIYYYHSDHLGTPQLMTNSAGTTVWKVSYEPFGGATVTVNTLTNNLRFAGMYSDSETGLYYWGSRYYDPKTGRSITPDRMSAAEHVQRWQANQNRLNRPPLEINPYVYVANNPLRWTDRTGRVIETWEPSDSITHDPIGWGLPGSEGSVCGSGFKVPEFSFRDACQKHDDCYGTCRANKTWCDFQFQWNAKQSCPAGDWRCQLLANIYFEAVLHLGGGAFDESQDKACKGGDCKK